VCVGGLSDLSGYVTTSPHLKFPIGGFGTSSRFLELRGDTVVARRIPSNFSPGVAIDTIRVVPTSEAWRAFWAAVDNAGVKNWNEQYVAAGVVDGEGWGLRVVSNDRQVESSGSNAYPDRGGRQHDLERTAEFQSFLAAVNALVGQSSWF
jgi:hypothetical protein